MITRLKNRLLRLGAGLSRDDGTTAVEFALMVPLFIMVFMASFESGLLMTRSIMLEQSVDMTMRELRLGHYTAPDTDLLKAEICRRTVIFKNCEANITIELTQINTTNFNLPSNNSKCINRSKPVAPVNNLVLLQKNDIMLVRVCVVQDALFPTTGIALQMRKDGANGYYLMSTSAFATEPS